MRPHLTLRVTDYNRDALQRAHCHDELHFSVILRGGVAETVGKHTEYAGPLAVVAKDAGVIHANQWGRNGARVARLTLPGASLAALAGDEVREVGWRWTHDPAVARSFLRLVRRSQEGEQGYDIVDDDIVDVIAAFTTRRTAESCGRPPAWLGEVVARIQNEWHPQCTSQSVAASARVHPVYLARCVRRWYGTGLGEMIRAQRRTAAVAAVSNTDQRLLQIALDHGYADEPHFCRDVRTAVGMSPGRLRAVVNVV